jgi:ribonuclease Y
VLRHSIEVSLLSGIIASELGLDIQLAKRCGLLHDIGKAVDHEVEGGHPLIGADLARRYNERPEVINAIGGHHDDVTPTNIYTIIVASADAISASRPGARGESLEKYIKRLERLEEVARSFPGIDSAYAIQAGREVRVIADANRVQDAEVAKVARDIAMQIEKELSYPGEIKVTLIRETRVVEYAR